MLYELLIIKINMRFDRYIQNTLSKLITLNILKYDTIFNKNYKFILKKFETS